MLIHPWDAALDPAEWQAWLASTDRFGMLAVNNLDPAQAPLVLPTHFTLAGDELLIHLARPEPGLAAPGSGRRGTAGGDRRLRLHPDLLAGQGRRARRGRRADQLLLRRAVRLPPNGGRRPRGQGRDPHRPARRLPARRPPRRRRRRRGPVRADAARHPRCPAGRAARGRQVQVRRLTTPSNTANASSATSRSAATGSTPAPRPSNGGASRRSVTGEPAAPRESHALSAIAAGASLASVSNRRIRPANTSCSIDCSQRREFVSDCGGHPGAELRGFASGVRIFADDAVERTDGEKVAARTPCRAAISAACWVV